MTFFKLKAFNQNTKELRLVHCIATSDRRKALAPEQKATATKSFRKIDAEAARQRARMIEGTVWRGSAKRSSACNTTKKSVHNILLYYNLHKI